MRRGRPAALGVASLTPRQRQLLKLRCLGFSVGEVAERCYISPRTVQTTLYAAYARLGVGGTFKAGEACYLLGRSEPNRTAAAEAARAARAAEAARVAAEGRAAALARRVADLEAWVSRVRTLSAAVGRAGEPPG